ncbi:MAG TPA: hypothetical protein VFW04_19235 [Gemmatimonadaceae bacterium]|nr:hypothetical protein [Gemmatimonadaceae bacterium]
MHLAFSVLGLDVNTTNGNVSARQQVGEIATVQPRSGVPLEGLSLVFIVAGDDLTEGKHRFSVRVTGAHDSPPLIENEQTTLRAPSGEVHLPVRFSLSTAKFPTIGDYAFVIEVDGVEVGRVPVSTRPATKQMRAEFFSFEQKQEGEKEGERYFVGVLGFTLFNEDIYAGRYAVRASLPQGGNPETDPLHIILPPDIDTLGRSSSFRDAVKKAHDHYILTLFGGKYPRGEIKMADNYFGGGGIAVEFFLPDATGETAGW